MLPEVTNFLLTLRKLLTNLFSYSLTLIDALDTLIVSISLSLLLLYKSSIFVSYKFFANKQSCGSYNVFRNVVLILKHKRPSVYVFYICLKQRQFWSFSWRLRILRASSTLKSRKWRNNVCINDKSLFCVEKVFSLFVLTCISIAHIKI